ncbi:YadA domain-containing protein [Mycolicibacterium rhodesiae JS60]|nr:YadA domain-containing protein [Mycolicibacterium rhodesiae JS60]
MTTAAVSKFSALSTKLQVSTAAVAVAAAAAITPAVAHAAPSLAPFSTNVGNSAELLLDSVVIASPGSNKTASAAASASATPVQVVFGGLAESVNQFVGATVAALGYGTAAVLVVTGNVISLLLPALGAPITAAGVAVSNATTSYVVNQKIGPYSTL